MSNSPIYVNLPIFLLGLVIIVRGSDLFLDNAVWAARASGIPQIIVGATIVSVCTTLPELVSSCTAAIKNAPDMAVGNAVGSVICNTGFIMGGMLLFVVARVNREIFLVKGVFMLGAIGIVFALIIPGRESPGLYHIGRAEGVPLLVFLTVYLVVNYYESLHTVLSQQETDEPPPPKASRQEWGRHLLGFAAGAALVAFGAYLLVEFGQRLARDFGVRESVISLVFVAFGTSLPELFTAISAVRKKAEQISVGNIFGANVMNIGLVTGAAAVIHPLTIDDTYLARIDIPVAFTLCTVAFLSGLLKGRMGRRTGMLLITLYGAYVISMAVMERVD